MTSNKNYHTYPNYDEIPKPQKEENDLILRYVICETLNVLGVNNMEILLSKYDKCNPNFDNKSFTIWNYIYFG